MVFVPKEFYPWFTKHQFRLLREIRHSFCVVAPPETADALHNPLRVKGLTVFVYRAVARIVEVESRRSSTRLKLLVQRRVIQTRLEASRVEAARLEAARKEAACLEALRVQLESARLKMTAGSQRLL